MPARKKKKKIMHINSSISNNSVWHKYMVCFCLHTVKCKTVLFQAI